jgi:DNA polymerase-3 subunit delta'
MWEQVVGQDHAVGLLQRAVPKPLHAYLLAGPAGSGVREAARCFAASLICPQGGCGTCSACRRALSARHPDVVEVVPAGTFIVKDQVEDMVREAFSSPFEAERKVILVFESDRMNETAANKLLKTLEEPPERTHFLLQSEAPDEMLPTVRSRCQRIDFAALSDAVVGGALTAAGVTPEAAAIAARRSAGRLDRARALVGPFAPIWDVAPVLAAHLDGSGTTVAGAAERLAEALGRASSAVEAAHAQDAARLEAELNETSYPDRVSRRLRKELTERQQREARRVRTDALAEVVTALESVYRDSLVAASTGGEPLVPADAALDALDACRAARTIVGNRTAVNETLLLEHLLLRLPPAKVI